VRHSFPSLCGTLITRPSCRKLASEINDHRVAFGAPVEVALPFDVRQDILDSALSGDPELYDVAREQLRKNLATQVTEFEEGVKCVPLT